MLSRPLYRYAEQERLKSVNPSPASVSAWDSPAAHSHCVLAPAVSVWVLLGLPSVLELKPIVVLDSSKRGGAIVRSCTFIEGLTLSVEDLFYTFHTDRLL
jgi:hypothetical protein